MGLHRRMSNNCYTTQLRMIQEDVVEAYPVTNT